MFDDMDREDYVPKIPGLFWLRGDLPPQKLYEVNVDYLLESDNYMMRIKYNEEVLNLEISGTEIHDQKSFLPAMDIIIKYLQHEIWQWEIRKQQGKLNDC